MNCFGCLVSCGTSVTVTLSVVVRSFSAVVFQGTALIFILLPSETDPVPAQLPAQDPVLALVLAVAQVPLLPQAALGAPAPHAVPVQAALLDLPVPLDGDMTTGDDPAPSEFYLSSRNCQVSS